MKRNILQRRPAESATLVAGALALLLMRVLGVTDPDVKDAVTLCLVALPSVVTWVVASGGLWALIRRFLGV